MKRQGDIKLVSVLLCFFLPKSLGVSDRDLDHLAEEYGRQGFASPVPVFSSQEVSDLRDLFDRLEAAQPGGHFPGQAHNLHLANLEVWEWVRHPMLTRATERVAGFEPGELLVFASTFVTKYPVSDAMDPSVDTRFGWHQDVLYWDLEPRQSLTAWIAIDPVTEQSGCVRMIAGNHTGVEHEHTYLPHADNMLLSKKEIVGGDFEELQENTCVVLNAGEMSVHDGWTPHGSGPNQSPYRRAGLVLNYMPANATLQPSREGYGSIEDGALIEEFRKPVDPGNSTFPPRVLQVPPVHERWRVSSIANSEL